MALCKCSKCILKKYVDVHNVEHQGVPLDARQLRQHALDDKFREASEKARQKARADVANDLVLATIGAPSRPDASGLPVRPKSRRPTVQDEADEGQSEDDEVGASISGESGVRTFRPCTLLVNKWFQSPQNPGSRDDPGRMAKSTSMSDEEVSIPFSCQDIDILIADNSVLLPRRNVCRASPSSSPSSHYALATSLGILA